MSPWFLSSRRPQLPQEQPTQRLPSHSLLHYETGSPPPSARVDPKLKLQPRRPLRLWDYWKFGAIVAAKATEVTSDILSHHIWGPRRKSWGIEMTIVTSLIRGAERHSALVDIGTIRMLMSIGGIVPLPSDALVSPVTFRVKKRKLRGILADFDAKEDGQRELCGEWVVGLKTWQRMQKEWQAARKPHFKRSSSTIDCSAPSELLRRKERVVLYIHGGAYYLSSAAAQRIISIPLAKYTDSRVFALDYRLAPETCFPGPLHDTVSAYLRLIEELHIPPENIILAGDSAGGGLCLALLMYLRDNKYPLPSGAILMSPWVDLTMSCESWDANAPYDVVPFPTADNHMNPIALYLGEHTEEYLTHPYASPLFGDFKGLPPLLVQAGDAEVLRDEIALMAHKATLAGVQVMHELYEDAIHVFQAYPFLEASRRSFESMRDFVRIILPQYQSRSPQLLADVAERGMEREIDSGHLIVVGGDGVEETTSFEHLRDYGTYKPSALTGKPRGDANTEPSQDTDDRSSWTRSPSQKPFSAWKVGAGLSDKGCFEHFEDAHLQDIPHLTLTPSSPPSPGITHPVPTFFDAKRPNMLKSSSFLSTASSSSFQSPTPVSPPPRVSPRRIRSTSSLIPFIQGRRHNHNDTTADGVNFVASSLKHRFSFDFCKASYNSHDHSRSGTMPYEESSLSMSSQNPVPPSPSIRKRRLSSGLMMMSKRGKHATPMWVTTGEKIHGISETQSTSPAAMSDVKTLIDEWTRLGPANKTVLVSAQPSSQHR